LFQFPLLRCFLFYLLQKAGIREKDPGCFAEIKQVNDDGDS
jgi:hypothetical protein